MNSKIQQVLLTYWRRGTSGFLPVAFLLFISIVILQMMFLGAKIPAGFIWISLYGTAFIAIHLKQQVVQVRERRMPGVLGAHLGVGLALLLLVGVVIPMNRMFIEWHWCWGYPGLCLAITGVTLAGFATQAQILTFFFFLVPLGGQFEVVRSWIEALWRGELESSGVLLMAIGLGSIAFSIYWLLTSTEEDRGYHLRFPNKQTDIYRRDPVDTEQSEALKDFWRRRGWFTPREPSGSRMADWRNWARGSLWQQLKLWEFGRTGGSGLLLAIVFPLMFILPQLFFTRNFQLSSMMTNPFFAFPVYFLLQMRLQQRAVWETEFLRPVARTKFFRLAGLGIAGLVFALWLGFVAVAVVVAAILSPEQLTTELVARFALVTAIGQMWILAVGIWMARYRSMVFFLVGFIVPIMLIAFVGAAATSMGRDNAPDFRVLAGCFAISCVLCACILYDAYRRWQRVELT